MTRKQLDGASGDREHSEKKGRVVSQTQKKQDMQGKK